MSADAPTTDTIDFDKLRADEVARQAELEEQRAALALDVLSDAGKQKDLLAVEEQLHSSRRELERIDDASAEAARREEARRAQERLEYRQGRLQAAVDLNEPRRLVARKLDKAVDSMLAALAEYVSVSLRQRELLKHAGGVDWMAGQLVVEPRDVEGALSAAVPQEHAELWRLLTGLSPASVALDHRRRFADSCVPVEIPTEDAS